MTVGQLDALDSQLVKELVDQGLGCASSSADCPVMNMMTYVNLAVGVYSRSWLMRVIAIWSVRGRKTLLKGWGLI
jgi:hypothetical protein